MSVSNTGGHGRGGNSGRIIGDVINHGKHDFWGKSNVHYHQGMKVRKARQARRGRAGIGPPARRARSVLAPRPTPPPAVQPSPAARLPISPDRLPLTAAPQAGENTLNALCARVVMRGMAEGKGYSAARFLSDYVAYMTTPGSHNDTYAESFHRWAAAGAAGAGGAGAGGRLLPGRAAAAGGLLGAAAGAAEGGGC
jgi:hypothetical protein